MGGANVWQESSHLAGITWPEVAPQRVRCLARSINYSVYVCVCERERERERERGRESFNVTKCADKRQISVYDFSIGIKQSYRILSTVTPESTC